MHYYSNTSGHRRVLPFNAYTASVSPAWTNNLGQPSQSESHHFVRRDFPQSAQTAENGAEYLRCQETGPPHLPQERSTNNNAPEGVAQELGPMSCSVAPSGEIDWTTLSYAALIDYFSVQDTGHMSVPQEYAWYQDNGAPAYQANTSCSSDSGGDDCPDDRDITLAHATGPPSN
ncbi:hypothetical protein JB92DRAFT_2834927 [Gautieria morchelliformis]|nr:hypothetical protein JB92DRAFT_2834927 [Gautieria morchelliformis]